MKTIELNTWEEFEVEATRLISERKERVSSTDKYISEYLFRGQADASWELTTTLERYSGRLLSLEEYYRILCRTKPQVETFTGATWEGVPSLHDYMDQIGGEPKLLPGQFPAYEYFIYLRHHGFPSPLLDWTRSPYVAAYFAFRDVLSKSEKISIYAYCEYSEGYKTGSGSKPEITGLGPYARSHRRHFQQQCEYTICTVYANNKLTYARHEDVFSENNQDQDELWKFNLPSSERCKVLDQLELYNINSFSLFGSEESLMETLSFREIYLKD